MRYRYVTEPILDINGAQLHYGDFCEFTFEGKVHQGQIGDSGDDYRTEWSFYKDGQLNSSFCRLCRAEHIKLLKRSESWGEELKKIVKIEDLLLIRFEKEGFQCEEHPHGMLVNNRFIIASKKNKWRVVGKNKWYYYKNFDSMVRYIRS